MRFSLGTAGTNRDEQAQIVSLDHAACDALDNLALEDEVVMKTGMVVRMATADMLPHSVNYNLSRCVKACSSLHEAHDVRGILLWSICCGPASAL